MTEEVKRMLRIINEDTQLDYFDIEKTFKNSYERLFTKATGFYANHGTVHGIKDKIFKIDYNAEIEINTSKFYLVLKERNISLSEFEYYHCNTTLVNSFYADKEKGFIMSNNNVDSLVFFLRHVATGLKDNNLKESHEYMEANGLRYNTEKFKFTIGNCTIERFKNGTLKISDGRVIDILLRLKEINDLLS